MRRDSYTDTFVFLFKNKIAVIKIDNDSVIQKKPNYVCNMCKQQLKINLSRYPIPGQDETVSCRYKTMKNL